MSAISHAQIQAARNGDLEASGAIVAGTEGMVIKLAYEACQKAARPDLQEDMEQTGRLTVWEAVSRYEGRDGATFATYVYRAIEMAIDNALRLNTTPGVGEKTMKTFKRCLAIAEGDVVTAEKLCTVIPDSEKRLSKDTARAARLAWEGTTSLDAPTGDADGTTSTLADLIPDPNGYGVPEDLIEPRDIERAQREQNQDLAHALLRLVTERKRFILKATHGISPVPHYADDSAIARDLDVTASTVRNHRRDALTLLRGKGEALFLAGRE